MRSSRTHARASHDETSAAGTDRMTCRAGPHRQRAQRVTPAPPESGPVLEGHRLLDPPRMTESRAAHERPRPQRPGDSRIGDRVMERDRRSRAQRRLPGVDVGKHVLELVRSVDEQEVDRPSGTRPRAAVEVARTGSTRSATPARCTLASNSAKVSPLPEQAVRGAPLVGVDGDDHPLPGAGADARREGDRRPALPGPHLDDGGGSRARERRGRTDGGSTPRRRRASPPRLPAPPSVPSASSCPACKQAS